jgi:glyoxylase-like metal-dependent hydrolase (beta-lactamase superfamily II)
VVDRARHTRRQILKTALGGAAGLVLAGPASRAWASSAQAANPAAAAVATGVQRLADDLFVLSLPGETNVVARTTANGVLLVDGVSLAGADALLRAVAALPGGRPVTTLVNTHWHPEQTGSNARLASAGATIVAQENTRLWLTTDVTWPWNGTRFVRLPRAAQPSKTFFATMDIAPGVRAGHIPDAAHTDGDLYVQFRDHNVLAVGDAVCGEGWPVVDYITGGWMGGIVGGLERLLALTDAQTRIVPARGPVLTQADLKAQYQMYATLYVRLTDLLNKGRSPEEAVAATPAKEFDAAMGNPDEFVRRAFESLWGYLSPDA